MGRENEETCSGVHKRKEKEGNVEKEGGRCLLDLKAFGIELAHGRAS